MQREFQGSGISFWVKVILGILLLKVLFSSGLIWMLLLGGAIWYVVKSKRHGFCFDGEKRKRTVRTYSHESNGKVKNDDVVII